MSESEAQSVQEKLSEEIGTVPWNALEVHAKGGTLVLVAPDLDLIEVGVAIAEDQTENVQSWLKTGLIRKPDEDEINSLSEVDGTPFSFLIVQPFVIAKAVLI
tara:strand:+ start:31 stop:339 length:309 start_codon:yes stop_codon:yes gene_type:complete